VREGRGKGARFFKIGKIFYLGGGGRGKRSDVGCAEREHGGGQRALEGRGETKRGSKGPGEKQALIFGDAAKQDRRQKRNGKSRNKRIQWKSSGEGKRRDTH